MDEILTALDISAADWAATPAAVQARLQTLLVLVPHLQQHLSQALARQGQLEARIADLEARLNLHSQNSSRPPSSDPPSAPPRPTKAPTGRKRGGQPGHRRHTRPDPNPEQIVARPEYWPQACPHCQHPLGEHLPDAAPARIHYIWDLPEIQPEVTAHTLHVVACPDCGQQVAAPRPPQVPRGAFGPRLTSFVGLLRGQLHASHRAIAEVLATWCQIPLSVGMVPKLQQVVSTALAPVVDDLQVQVQQASVVNVDDTGWAEASQQRWLWVVVAAMATLFAVGGRDKAKTARQLIGPLDHRFVGTDRGRATLHLSSEHQQFCWAHLRRNFRALSERRGDVGRWAADLLALSELVFRLWHAYQGGSLSHSQLQTAMGDWVQPTLRARLEAAPERSTPALALRDELLAHWPALWTFLSVPGLEPTNNRAERALRPAVLWRKRSYGADSAAGNLFVARILSVVTTCRQRQQPTFPFLLAVITCYLRQEPVPLLA